MNKIYKGESLKMVKLNCLQYVRLNEINISKDYSVSALSPNDTFDNLCLQYYQKFKYKKIKTFGFSKEGFLGLLLELKGTIAISIGETQALIDGAKLYEKLGFEIHWIPLSRDGTVNLYGLKNENIDFLFISSYVMDTFVKIDLKKVRKNTKAKIISNGTANIDTTSDAVYFDNYKLNGYNVSGVMLFDDDFFDLIPIGLMDTVALKLCYEAIENRNFNHTVKNIFLDELLEVFNDEIYFFVNAQHTLEYSLHFGFKGIKARELIRTIALSKIFISNGEGCSLGLSKPSRIIQEMGYDEVTCSTALSLSFNNDFSLDEIKRIVYTLYMKYKQLKILNEND